MLLIEWRFWLIQFTLLILLAVLIRSIRVSRKIKSLWLRYLFYSVSLPATLLVSLIFVFLIAGEGCISHSGSLYSPSRQSLARIENLDGGALGGDTNVKVYWAFGFREETVYSGFWKTVELPDVKWIDDTTLQIAYEGHPYDCHSTKHIRVICIPKLTNVR